MFMVPTIHIGALLSTFPDNPQNDTLSNRLIAAAPDSLRTEIIITDHIARYKLGEMWRILAGDDVVNYLEAFELDLEDPQFEQFSVYKIRKSLSDLDAEMLGVIKLSEYFSDEPDLQMLAVDHPASPIEKFKNAEHLLLFSMIKAYQWTESCYKPIPIRNESGQLERMTYLIYDETYLQSKYGEEIDMRRLENQITRS